MQDQKPGIIVIGNRSHSKQILAHILRSGWNVLGAIGASGELARIQSGFASFEDLCQDYDVPLLKTADINDEAVVSFMAERQPDIGICAGWTQIISDEVLSIPEHGIAGFHASPLPKGRGGAPANWQMILDREFMGISLFYMTAEVDDGDILGQRTVPVEPRDDIMTVYNRLTSASCEILDHVIPALAEGTLDLTEQDLSKATYFPLRKLDDGLIDWSWDARFLSNWVRAQTHPYPGAFTFYNGERLKIWEASVSERPPESARPGTIVSVVDGEGVDVATGSGMVRLERVQWADRPPQWADDFVEGTGLGVDSELGRVESFPDWLYTGIRDGDGGFRFDTNLPVGQSGHLQAVCCSHATTRPVRISASLDGESLVEEIYEVNGWMKCRISYQLEGVGSHTLKVTFRENNEKRDVRRLKIYGRR